MSNYAYVTAPKSAIVYAKPLNPDLATTPSWASDAIDFTESAVAVPTGKRNTFRSNLEVDPAKNYQVFQQVAGAKASSDTRIAFIPQTYDASLTEIE